MLEEMTKEIKEEIGNYKYVNDLEKLQKCFKEF